MRTTQVGLHDRRGIDEQGLGQFEFDCVGRQPGADQCRVQDTEKARRAELQARDIDRNLGRAALGAQASGAARTLQQDPFAEPYDQPGLLGDGDELQRGHLLAADSAAHQGLDRLDAAVRANDGLIVQLEIAGCQRSLQYALDLQVPPRRPRRGRRARRFGSDDEEAVATLALGLAHRTIGTREQAERIVRCVPPGEADAHRRPEEDATKQDWLIDDRQQSSGNPFGVRGLDHRQQQRELVTSHAQKRRPVTGDRADAPGDARDDGVRLGKSERVIDLAEAVEVEPHRAQRCLCLICHGEQACQQALAGTAQVKSGRRVAGGRLRTVCCPSWHAKPAARRSLPFDDVAPFQRQEKLPLQPFRWLRGQGYAAAESAA